MVRGALAQVAEGGLECVIYTLAFSRPPLFVHVYVHEGERKDEAVEKVSINER